MNPFVSIIILNCNGKKFLNTCLNSLEKQTYKNFEIILVDNGSADDSVEFLRGNFSGIKIIENEKNLGFAEGNNQGIKISKGEYIVTLNNDTRVDENWLKNLVFVAMKDEKIGMCASKILSIHKTDIIDSVGILLSVDGMTRGKGRLETDDGQYDNEKNILLPSACAALYKKKMLDEIGLFDEDFFAYCEDSDLGLRGRLFGWKAIFVPNAKVYHYYSGTMGKYSPFKAYLVERNHILFAIKTFPVSLLVILPFVTFHRFFIQFVSIFAGKGSTSEMLKDVSFFSVLKIVFKAYTDVLINIPKFTKKRKKVQKNKKISNKEFYGLLREHRLTLNELVFKK